MGVTARHEHEVNPVRRPLALSQEGLHGGWNIVFVPIGKLHSPCKRPEVLRGSSPLQAAGLSNGVNGVSDETNRYYCQTK